MKQNNMEKRDNDIKEWLKYKGTEFWKEKLKNMGIQVEPFDSIEIIGKDTPLPNYVQGEPILTDTFLGGKKMDVYSSNHKIFLREKE